MDAALCARVVASLGSPDDIFIARYGLETVNETRSVNGTKQTGTPQYFIAPISGTYSFTVRGASGSMGSNERSGGATYNPTPGKAAIVSGNVTLQANDNIMIVVGQQGENVRAATTDGASGASGGATFVLRQISSITDNRYQISYLGKNWEILYVAAGGGGTNDSAYQQSAVNGPDAATILYTLTNFAAYSTSTLSTSSSISASSTTVLGVQQLVSNNGIGTFYTRGANSGYGGYGGGTVADDAFVIGGGWSLAGGKTSSFAAYTGSVAVAAALLPGECIISVKNDVPNDWGYWYNPVTDRVLSDCVYGNTKGCINSTVLNRLECNTEYLKLYMDYLRIECAICSTDVDKWTRLLYLKETEFKRLQQNLLKLRATGAIKLDTPVINTSAAEDFMGYQLLNNMEKILLDIKDILDIMKKSFMYVGDMYCGDFQYGGEGA